MPLRIALLGKEEKNFQFVQTALNKLEYEFQFYALEHVYKSATEIADADLLIVDTLPFPEEGFKDLFILRDDVEFSLLPALALVKDQPVRLRYRLVEMGFNDYLTVPFDPLDLRVRVQNLLTLSRSDDGDRKFPQPANTSAQLTLDALKKLVKQPGNGTASGDTWALPSLMNAILGFCNAAQVLYFDTNPGDQLALKNATPDGFLDDSLVLSTRDLPVLQKAIRQHKPTILNKSTAVNSFANYINSMLNLRIKSYLVYPIVVNNKTSSVLIILKTDEEAFTEHHFLYVQIIANILATRMQFQVVPARNGHSGVKGLTDIRQYHYGLLSQVIDQLNSGIIVTGADGKIRYVNTAATLFLQVEAEAIVNQPLQTIIDAHLAEQIYSLENQSPLSVEQPELEMEGPGGQKILIGFSTQPFKDPENAERGHIITLKDITYTKEIQEELRRVDRLASLGVMASGIAHEIRNPLAGIKAMAQTFEEELDPDDPKSEYVQRIVRLVNRLDELLRTLFSYAKPPKPDRRNTEVNDIIQDVLSLLRQKIRENDIEFVGAIGENLPRIYVDPGQIQQVLINLILNSVESIQDDGQIRIDIDGFEPGENAEEVSRIPQLALMKSQPYVRIFIEDNGCGIPADNLKHIFNPFFTTKTFGTGLGLSIVYQIVKENDGAIFYESELDKGTRCYLYLPVENTSIVIDQGN